MNSTLGQHEQGKFETKENIVTDSGVQLFVKRLIFPHENQRFTNKVFDLLPPAPQTVQQQASTLFHHFSKQMSQCGNLQG
jgi:hypothetical protein